MKRAILILSTVIASISLLGQNRAINNTEVMKIPMKAAQWEFEPDQVEFLSYKGVSSMKVLTGRVPILLKDVLFESGTIEFDLEILNGPFCGINFRRTSGMESERFYLRPYRTGNPMGEDAAQYAPVIKGANLWDMRYEYQGPADIKGGDWNHVKLVISGKRMLVYVNDMERPALSIPELGGNNKSGGLSFDGNIVLANLVLKPGQVEGLSPKAQPDPTAHDIRYLRQWQVSQPVSFPFGRDIVNDDLPNEKTNWQAISAERLGLINLTRVYGGPTNNERRLVWLKTTIKSNQAKKVQLDLGFSDEVWVIINDGLLYVDKNYYTSPIRKEPKGRCAIENSSFDIPLREGDNELLIGVGNFFFGWGIIARLKDVEGLSFKLQ